MSIPQNSLVSLSSVTGPLLYLVSKEWSFLLISSLPTQDRKKSEHFIYLEFLVIQVVSTLHHQFSSCLVRVVLNSVRKQFRNVF